MISKEEVKHIADLALLKLSEKEIERMQSDLSEILDYIKLLEEADFSSLKESGKNACSQNDLRDDKAKAESREAIEAMLSQANQREKNYLKVKKIL